MGAAGSVNSCGNIAIEDLPLASVLPNGNLSLSTHDSGFGQPPVSGGSYESQ